MPAYYLYAVLPKIGGCGLTVQRDGQTCGYGFLFPRQMEGDTPVYTLRYHRMVDALSVDPDELTRQTAYLLTPRSQVIFYDPLTPKSYAPSHQIIGDLDVGRPDAAEAAAIRTIHQAVWNNPPEILYPVDMHSTEFALPTSLVARPTVRPPAFSLA
jgi:hypothetical protein